jgi:hypothetical protein
LKRNSAGLTPEQSGVFYCNNIGGAKLIINVLGTEYKIEFKLLKDDNDLKTCDGYCDNHTNTIVVRNYTEDERKEDNMTGNLDEYNKKVLRHEIVHAFLYQSGLSVNSMQYSRGWSQCEEMVDWIAIQFPKILKAFQDTNCL